MVPHSAVAIASLLEAGSLAGCIGVADCRTAGHILHILVEGRVAASLSVGARTRTRYAAVYC